MARPARPLRLVGGATAFVVLALSVAAFLRGPGDLSAAEIARAYEVVPDDEPPPIDPADLAAPEHAASPERTEIVDEALLAEEEAAAELAARPRCKVEGVILAPRTFPPRADVTVMACPVDVPDQRGPVERSFGSHETWRFDDLLPGKWVLVARAEADGRIAWGRTEEMALVPEVQPGLVRIAVDEYVVEGVVTDTRGMPIPNLPIRYEWDGDDPYSGEEIEDVGHIALLNGDTLSSGTIRISFEASDLQLVAQEELQAVNFQPVQSYEPAQIEESFTNLAGQLQSYEGSPNLDVQLSQQLANAWIDASAIEGLTVMPMNSFEFNSWASETVTTDAAGRFRIALSGPGRVDITAPQRDREVAPGEARWIEERARVEITKEAPAGTANFELVRAASVRGRVVRSDGEGTDDISVFLRRKGASTVNSSVNGQGEFSYETCRPGEYLFYARGGGRSGQDFSLHLAFELKEGEEFWIDDVLTQSSTAEGLVLDDTGAPLVGATVTAYGLLNDNLKRTGRTDDSGRFRIVGMYGCEYRFVVEKRQLVREVTATVAQGADRVDVGTIEVVAKTPR